MTPEQLNALPDEMLLARMRDGDGSALACFYDRSAPVLYSVAKRILRDASLAEDVLQEVFAQIWKKAALFDPALGKPMNWAITLTRNRALDKLRSVQRWQAAVNEFAEENPPSAGAANSSNEQMELWVLARKALGELPEKQRRALELAFVQGFAHPEIAAQMQEPLGTVKAWIRRGLLALRQRMAEETKLESVPV